MRNLLLVLFVFSFATARAQTLGFTFAEGQKRADIPIQIHNNLIVVSVTLNEALPLKFIVDTGVRTAILTQKIFSDILDLKYTRKYTIAGPGGNKFVDAYITNNVSLSLPGINGTPGIDGLGHTLLVLEDDILELRNYLGVDVHGILGYELFSRFVIKIDYKKKVMTLYAPQKFRPGKRFQELPMAIEDTKPFILAPLNINSDNLLTAKLLVDTGASHGLLLEQTSDKRIVVPQNRVSTILGRALGGVITGKIGRVESLELGKFALPKVITNFPDPNSYLDTLKHSVTFRNGSVGGEILSRFTVVFNFPQGKLYLKKNSDFKKPFYLNLSGLEIKAKGSKLDVYEVVDVRDLSPARKAGVSEGDLIVSVNGILTKDMNLNQLNALLNSAPGKKVRVEIERNKARQRLEFKLESQI
ncbi:MAG TPA: aspartyl protease family protein [Cyclobacteriaceae bacterium]|nr:aspartyl protease family protein [Cyclobacteriaceae bacterium]